MIKVVKFGGSSLASAEQFMKVKDIIKADPDRRFIVPSAPGKRNSADTKVTDMLYHCYALAEEGHDFDDALAQIKDPIRESSTDFPSPYRWIRNSRRSGRILRSMPARITRLPAANI